MVVRGSDLKNAGYSYLLDAKREDVANSYEEMSLYKSSGKLYFEIHDSSNYKQSIISSDVVSKIPDQDIILQAGWDGTSTNLSILSFPQRIVLVPNSLSNGSMSGFPYFSQIFIGSAVNGTPIYSQPTQYLGIIKSVKISSLDK